MKQPVVILDIDYTIFDTDSFRTAVYKRLATKLRFIDFAPFLDLTKQIETKTKLQVGYFDPKVFLQLLRKETETELSQQDLEDIFFDENLYRASLYEEVADLFQKFVDQNIQLVIFSTGEEKFQTMKLTGIKELLHEEHIHIFVDKLLDLKDVLQKYQDKQVYLVDDLSNVLQEAKSADPSVKTILIDRNNRFLEQDFRPDFVIENLTKIVTIVTKN